MKTLSIQIENLFVPCCCVCRHCLLCAHGKTDGVPYDRAEAFAEKFHQWILKKRPELHMNFYVGCCNDFPELTRYIRFLKKTAPQINFLQFNGLMLRNEAETAHLLTSLRDNGMEGIDLTFYGVGEYHDRFAGRSGDYEYLWLIMRKANELGVKVSVSIAVTQENLHQMPQLMSELAQYSIAHVFAMLPHAKGRGQRLQNIRLTEADFENMDPVFRSYFGTIPRLTEAEWIRRGNYPEAEGRHLTLALTMETMDRLENMDPSEIIRELEEMDDAYYAAIPAAPTLAELVGRPTNQQVYRWRDLFLEWQKRYLVNHPIEVPDMNDERHSFSVRVYNERIRLIQ